VIWRQTWHSTGKMTEPADDPLGATLYRVAVRLPPIWPDRPALWFAQPEAQFDLAGITRQRTQFNYVVSQLHQQHAKVEDIITGPPEHEAYDRLKAELVHRLSTSREQRVRQLLSHEEMGDRKPSQFLRHLKGLAPDVPEYFLSTIWASRLPPHIQAILAGQTEGSLDSASHLADRICEVAPQPTTACVSPSTPDNASGLLERIEELSRQVASLRATDARRRPRSSSRSSENCRSTTPGNSPTRHVCWYHRRFGDEARKCSPPCSCQQGNFASSRCGRQTSAPPLQAASS
jgi:hypothetical protein